MPRRWFSLGAHCFALHLIIILVFSEYYENSCQIASKFVVDPTYQIFFSTRNQCQGDDFPTEPIFSSFLNLFSPPNFTQILSNHIEVCRRSEFNVDFFFNEEPMPRRWFSLGAHCFALHLIIILVFSEYYENSCQIASKFVVDPTYQIFFSTRNQCQGDDFPTEPIVSSSSLLFI